MKPALNVRKLKRNPTLKICDGCNFKYPATEITCTACGRPLVDLLPSSCVECGASLEPGEEICSTCERENNKTLIRPLVEAAVIGDGRLSKVERDFIIRTAIQAGINSQGAETLILELLQEFGAVDECNLPILKVEPLIVRFVGVQAQSDPQYLKIENIGGGEMTGMVISKAAWLKASPNIINSKAKNQTVTLILKTNLLRVGSGEKGLLQVETSGGNIDVEVHVDTQPKPVSAYLEEERPTTMPLPQQEPESVSENSKAVPSAESTSSHSRAKSTKAGWVLGLAAVVVALIVITKWADEATSPVAGINDKLNTNQLVLPAGNSAYDLWRDLKSKDPSNTALAEVSKRALPILTSRGDQVMRRWHDEARATDQEWYELPRLYEWATLIDSSNKELQALKNYCDGQIAFREKRFDDALRAYYQALQNKQCLGLAYNGIGRVYANKKDYTNAAENYLKAAGCEPQWCYPYANLGGVYLQTKQYPLAEVYYQKAISVAPAKPSTHYQLAQLYEGWKRYCDGLGEYRKALDLAHNDPELGFTVERVQKRVSELEGKCR